MKLQLIHITLIAAIALLIGCNDEISNPRADTISIPIGRSVYLSNDYSVTINGQLCNYETIYDDCGSYWIQIPKTEISKGDTLVFRFTRSQSELELFQEDVSIGESWLSPSYFIDSDDDSIVSKALELTEGIESSVDKAIAIHHYLIYHIGFDLGYRRPFDDKASKTLDQGFGVCINFSRLYVALCRAAGLPARSVWGVVYGFNDDKVYDYHHQWAEVMDEEGYWHPTDFTYSKTFDLNDIRYMDMIYGAEENSVVKNRKKEEILIKDIAYLHNYPATTSGRLGFRLAEDNRPESMTIKYQYIY